MEDAALLRPASGSPLVFTVDFITPIVDEPETFGAIAVANSLSDVYAMGGEPQAALAICGFPEDRLPTEILERIFRGGRDKAAEAGCAIVGGHTVIDPELKYGLCVIGTVDADRALSQTGARPGDRLVLTKPLGIGVIAQAIKQGRLAAGEIAAAVEVMTTLNRGARDAALAAGSRAATDVTGFGLLGHLHHLALGSGCAARVRAGGVPLLPLVTVLAREGLVPGGSKRRVASHRLGAQRGGHRQAAPLRRPDVGRAAAGGGTRSRGHTARVSRERGNAGQRRDRRDGRRLAGPHRSHRLA
jgi:selenide,water dikinase